MSSTTSTGLDAIHVPKDSSVSIETSYRCLNMLVHVSVVFGQALQVFLLTSVLLCIPPRKVCRDRGSAVSMFPIPALHTFFHTFLSFLMNTPDFSPPPVAGVRQLASAIVLMSVFCAHQTLSAHLWVVQIASRFLSYALSILAWLGCTDTSHRYNLRSVLLSKSCPNQLIL